MVAAEEQMHPDSQCVDDVRPSPNRRPRTADERVRVVVVHGTWMPDDAAALDRLCDPVAEVSCHYYIDRTGQVFQLVRETDVAWHAGRSRWIIDGQVLDGLNPYSIGIEIGNAGPFVDASPEAGRELEITEEMWGRAEPYTEAAYDALIALLRDILKRYDLTTDAVVGHDQIAPARKSDPGRHFDWPRVRVALAK